MIAPLIGLNTEELRELAVKEGAPAYRGNQLAELIYSQRAHNFDEMTALPRAFRDTLKANYEVGRSPVIASQNSSDGTVKLLLELKDGSLIETVGLPYSDRYACCLSTQVGCPIGCVFCATGLSGFTRNLTAGEIVDEVLAITEALQSDKRVDHIVFMGMGEPLLNYEATLKAVRLLNGELGIAARHITISTVGFVPGMYRLADEKLQLTMAVSLHAAIDELRRTLVPGMTRWKVAEILEACHSYVKVTGRRVTIEYCLIGGVNDSPAQARELAGLLRDLNCHVNLIPFNPVEGINFSAAPPKAIATFTGVLREAGIQVTQRLQRGRDISASCGQLRRRFSA